MIRRRRPNREIPFSFDSFLDVVANVVGIIIRLILVVWVGARSYSTLQVLTRQPRPVPHRAAVAPAPAAAVIPEEPLPDPEDPLRGELARHRRELLEAQNRLLEQLRQLQQVQDDQGQIKERLTAVQDRERSLEQEKMTLEHATTAAGKNAGTATVSLADLQKRQSSLMEELRAVEKLPPLKHSLRYRTPLSRPVHTEELLFECRHGRVTFIDIASLLDEVRQGLEDKEKQLRTRWEASGTAGPAGAFRLRYTVERQAGTLDAVGGTPDAYSNFHYGLSAWTVEPVSPVRGEALEQALAPGSEFRRVADPLDPQLAVVTFWVYPDSFALYRQLRDFLYERDVVVAGRPLPEGVPISCTKHGSVSLGQ